MEAVPAATRPYRVDGSGPPPLAGESAELATLAEAGVALAPLVWVPPSAEDAFYRWNHLPSRLRELFAPVSEADPDEDDVEDLIPEAHALLARHALLDAWVDAFYDAIATLPDTVTVRRPGARGVDVSRGRPALLAIRAAWAEAWSFEAVLARLRASASVALEAEPLLLHDAGSEPAPPATVARVGEVLGRTCDVHADGAGRVTRLASPARP